MFPSTYIIMLAKPLPMAEIAQLPEWPNLEKLE